jgi:hypothetical protein
LAKQNPRCQEKEQPPPEHPQSLRREDDLGVIPAALMLASQKTKLWKNLRSKISLRQPKISKPQIPPRSRYSNNCMPSCRVHNKKEIGWQQPSPQIRGQPTQQISGNSWSSYRRRFKACNKSSPSPTFPTNSDQQIKVSLTLR